MPDRARACSRIRPSARSQRACHAACQPRAGSEMLEAYRLECTRGDRTLFRGLSFSVAPAQLLHLAGANGAGKTSLLRILCGLLSARARRGALGRTADSGDARGVCGATALHRTCQRPEGRADGAREPRDRRHARRQAVHEGCGVRRAGRTRRRTLRASSGPRAVAGAAAPRVAGAPRPGCRGCPAARAQAPRSGFSTSRSRRSIRPRSRIWRT